MRDCIPLSGLIRDQLMGCEAYFITTVSLFYHKTQEIQLFMFSFIFFVENVRNCSEASNIKMENESETLFTYPKNMLTSNIVSDYKLVDFFSTVP